MLKILHDWKAKCQGESPVHKHGPSQILNIFSIVHTFRKDKNKNKERGRFRPILFDQLKS